MAHRRTKRAYATVKKWMDGTGTSQPELAKVLGISQSHLCNVLRGNRKPSYDLAKLIAHVTNVPMDAICQTEKVA